MKSHASLKLEALALAFTLPLAASLAGASETRDLLQLSRAPQTEYTRLRDSLLLHHDQNWDVDAASRASGLAGLSALILNARANAPRAHAEWDAVRPRATRKGEEHLTRHPATWAATDSRAFLIEQLWRTAISESQRDDAFWTLIRQRVPGPPRMWRALLKEEIPPRLRGIAWHALTRHEAEGIEDLLRTALIARNEPHHAKLAILAGLRHHVPSYADDLLVATRRTWETDTRLTDAALAVLAAGNERSSRRLLHVLIQDMDQSLDMRTAAATACAREPQGTDMECLSAVLESEAPVELRAWMAWITTAYSLDEARPLLVRCLDSKEPAEVRMSAISALGLIGGQAEMPLLRTIATDPDAEPRVRRLAADILSSMERRQ